MKSHYECIVVGGGVAGSTAAYHLKKLGYEVCILEKTKGPHHKVCGEFLSFEALSYIKEMGILIDNYSPNIKYFKLLSPRSNVRFTFPLSGRGISRYKLDEELLNNAKNIGADVFRGIYMQAYQKSDNGFLRVETNIGDFYARYIFIATGKHDYSREHKRRGRDHSFVGLKTHIHLKTLSSEFKETIELFSFPGGYGGICPVECDTTNFCFIINKALYKSLNGNFVRVISYLRRSNPQLDSILAQADFIEPVCAISDIPYGFLLRQSHQKNVYSLGDQRAVIPSFAGDGMAIALSTAKNSVYEFSSNQNGMLFQTELMQTALNKQMHWALMAHTILKSSWLTDMCMSISRRNPFLIEKIFEKTRISAIENIYHNYEPVTLENSYSGR